MREASRAFAVRFLRAVCEQARPPHELFQSGEFLSLEKRDRRLTTELFYGILRNRERLDYFIRHLSRTAFQKLDSVVVWILRVGLYQLEFLRIPAPVAVHETVELCRPFGKTSASRFVNGLLRAFLRNRPPLPRGQTAEELAIRYSHPLWLVRRYLKRYGLAGAGVLMAGHNQPPASALWVNPFKSNLREFCQRLEQDGIPYTVPSGLPNSLVVSAPGFAHHPLYQTQQCFFMDLGSQEVISQVDFSHRRILGDFCAAPGGKSFLMASRLDPAARLYCCDSSWRRLRVMRGRAERGRVPRLIFLLADVARGAPFDPCFDFILLDVPCSGLGTLCSNPDIRWRFEEADLARMQRRQLSILSNGFSVLRPGSELIYSTCSTEPEENEDVIREFLHRRKDAKLAADPRHHCSHPQGGNSFFSARIRHC
ncbi:MAG: transcription antitermination factor NusB [Acidobacteriota bacterium]